MPTVQSWAQLISTISAVAILAILLGTLISIRSVFRVKFNKMLQIVNRMEELLQGMELLYVSAKDNGDKISVVLETAENFLELAVGHQKLAALQKEDTLLAAHETKRAAVEIKETANIVKETVAEAASSSQWKTGDPERRSGSKSPEGPDAMRIPDLPPPPDSRK